MSTQSWKDEFYSVEAYDTSLDTDLKCVDHAIQKWTGLYRPNLVRHNTTHARGDQHIDNVCDSNPLEINAKSCALCVRHIRKIPGSKCGDCPLAKVRGGVPCDEYRSKLDDSGEAPYAEWKVKDNPTPMLNWLYKARTYVLDNMKVVEEPKPQWVLAPRDTPVDTKVWCKNKGGTYWIPRYHSTYPEHSFSHGANEWSNNATPFTRWDYIVLDNGMGAPPKDWEPKIGG